MTYLLLAVSAVVVGGGALLGWRRPATPPMERPAVRSLVRVLHDQGELDAALRRAAQFERVVEATLHLRAEHYESMLGRARATPDPSGAPLVQRDVLEG